MELSEIKHIADIAQIEFTEEELKGFEKDFNETFELINKIKEIDTSDLDITFQVNDTVNNLREDKVLQSLTEEEALSNASDSKYGYFKIKKFVE